jgi:CheY-like chemotaxis protein
MTEAKILYVEDHEGNVYMMGKRLRRAGYETIVARDGAEAIAMARAHKPDLILMDINLPVIDGLEATRQIKASPETKHIPIIALSGFAMYDDREKTLAAGCDDYCSSPVDFQFLRTRIEELLSKESEA